MTDPTVRPVRTDDAEAIADIYRHYVTDTTTSFEVTPPSAGEMRRRITAISAAHPYLVCEMDGKVAGYCYVHPWKERAAYSATMETTIYLSPDVRGHGLGRMMMGRLLAECRSRGYHALIACITAENDESCRFHESIGFVKVSHFREVGHKFGRVLDVVDYEMLLD